MRILVLALALFPAAAMAQDKGAAPDAAQPAPAKCQSAQTQWAAQPHPDVRPHSLAQEPLASQYHPVLRRQNGCDVPVKIREDVGRQQR
jgi:hypothetical protein